MTTFIDSVCSVCSTSNNLLVLKDVEPKHDKQFASVSGLFREFSAIGRIAVNQQAVRWQSVY
jgi:hypothetical protein